MAKQHKGISWTDETWNPIVGCTKVSDGCRNCWAERMARLHYNKDFPNGWDGHVKLIPERLELPLRWRKPLKIAVGLMGDIFHPDVPDEFIDKVFQVVLDAPQHIFQILTKRPLRMMDYITQFPWGRVPDNLWLGVTVEDQVTADERIPFLLQTPGAVRWVSYEPALGPVDFSKKLGQWSDCPECGYEVKVDEDGCCVSCGRDVMKYGIDWIVFGVESGPGLRLSEIELAQSVVYQCKSAGVPVHVKQIHLNGKLSKNMDEWPEDLRVRQFPEVKP